MWQPMIALFTDFGTQDVYVAQVKGVILSMNPHATLVDLSHDVGPFDVPQAAYLLEKATRYFPAGTIVVAVVDPGWDRRGIHSWCVHRRPNAKVGPDNGIFTWVVEREGLREAYMLELRGLFSYATRVGDLHGRDIFGPVAAHLSLGITPECFGQRLIEDRDIPPPLSSRRLRGRLLRAWCSILTISGIS